MAAPERKGRYLAEQANTTEVNSKKSGKKEFSKPSLEGKTPLKEKPKGKWSVRKFLKSLAVFRKASEMQSEHIKYAAKVFKKSVKLLNDGVFVRRDPTSDLPPRPSLESFKKDQKKSDKETIYETIAGELPELPPRNPNLYKPKSGDYEFFELAKKRHQNIYASAEDISTPKNFNYDIPLKTPVYTVMSDFLKDDEKRQLSNATGRALLPEDPIYETPNGGYEIPIQIHKTPAHLYENIHGKNALYDNANIKTPPVHFLSKTNNSRVKSIKKTDSSKL